MSAERMRDGRFRRRPGVVDAVFWTGHEDDIAKVLAMVTKPDGTLDLPNDGVTVGGPSIGFVPPLGTLDIPTLHGVVTAEPGTWIVRGAAGDVWPVRTDIFESTYEPVE